MSKSRLGQVKLKPILMEIIPPRIIKTAVLPGEQDESLFIATPDGEISTVQPAKQNSFGWSTESFLDIRDLVMEDGLHGFEFHPDFCENGRFYLHYSVRDDLFSNDTIEEWVLPETGIPICVRTLLNIKWSFSNHTGTNTLSWNNGCLILLTGDGGSFDQVQRNTSFFGKVIAINVDYRPWKFDRDPLPASEMEELDPIRRAALRIVAKGLQNPSGFEVDGPIKYLTDTSEVEKVLVFSHWKKNFGWGTRDHEPNDYHRPTASYSHREVRSGGIIGGCVYHGDTIPDLTDRYIFADVGGSIFSLRCLQEEDNEPQVPSLLATEDDALTLTALGANRRRTRIFVGGYDDGVGGLYELVSQ